MRLLAKGGLGATFQLAVMLLLAMLTLWLARTIDLGAFDAPRAVTHEPDYIVDRFTMTRLSDSGEPHYALSAARMLHYPDDDTSHLDAPSLRQLNSANPDLRISARRGVLTAGGDIAHLHDTVEVFRAGARSAGKATDDLRITTAYLRILPDDDRADTPERVRIDNGKSVLTGTGMDFDNRYRHVRLRSAVNASFEKSGDARKNPGK